MATSYWGVDSVTEANEPGGTGCPTAASVVHTLGNGNVLFWGRYFGNKNPNASWSPMNLEASSEIQAEATAMQGIGVQRILCINSYGNYGGNYNDGYTQGIGACQGIATVIANSGGLILMPSTYSVYVYLDVEGCDTLSSSYWQGWSDAVNTYSYDNELPFYACVYMNPDCLSGETQCCGSSANHCAAVSQSYPYTCYGVWSSEPENGNPCSFPGPGWGGQHHCPTTPPYTLVWQYTEGCGCGAVVDLDLTTTGEDMAPTMLYVYP